MRFVGCPWVFNYPLGAFRQGLLGLQGCFSLFFSGERRYLQPSAFAKLVHNLR